MRSQVYLLLGAMLRVNAGWLELPHADHADSSGRPSALAGGQEHDCLPCEELFTKLEKLPDGTHQQAIRLQLRG